MPVKLNISEWKGAKNSTLLTTFMNFSFFFSHLHYRHLRLWQWLDRRILREGGKSHKCKCNAQQRRFLHHQVGESGSWSKHRRRNQLRSRLGGLNYCLQDSRAKSNRDNYQRSWRWYTYCCFLLRILHNFRYHLHDKLIHENRRFGISPDISEHHDGNSASTGTLLAW